MIDKVEQYHMVRAPSDVVIGGIEFKRPDRETGLLGLNGRHITESNRAYVSLPGGGFLNFWGRDIASQPNRPSGNAYTDCLSPFDDHPDATLKSAFTLAAHRFESGVGVTWSMPSDARDRSYSWHINRIIEEAVTGEFLTSDAPSSIETDDGQSGLDDYLGHLTPCPRGDIRSCDCCRCPADDCGIKSIRHRKHETPTYACNSQDCDAEFEEPALRPARKESEPNGD
jgi:hypothetical protein